MNCPDCGRRLPPAQIPKDATPKLAAALRSLSKVCKWCLSVALCGGDAEGAAPMSGFTEDEKAEIRRLGAERKAELLASGKRRKSRAKRA